MHLLLKTTFAFILNRSRIQYLLQILILLWGFGASHTVLANATWVNLAVSPLNGTADASGNLSVTITGTVRAANRRDAVSMVNVLRNGTQVAYNSWRVTYVGGEYPLNEDRPFGVELKLGVGTHQIVLNTSTEMGLEHKTQAYTVTVAGAAGVNGASYVSQSVPSTMVAGQRYTVSVTMRNSGTLPWNPGGTKPHGLGSVNPHNNSTWGIGRIRQTSTVAVGANTTYSFTITAPSTPGTYNFQWQMVQEEVEWFGSTTPNVAVRVESPPAAPSISVSPVPLALKSGASSTVTWSTTNATSVSRTCTASGTGYKGTVTLAASGSRVETGDASWVGYPSTCTWTATGPGGTKSLTQTMQTTASTAAPTITVSPTPLNLIVGQTTAVTWTTTNATSVARSCTASGTGYVGNLSLAASSTRSETGNAAWIGYPSTCTWTATGPGGSRSTTQTMTTVAAPPVPTANISMPANYSYFATAGATAPVAVQGTAIAVGGSAITKLEILNGTTVLDTKTGTTNYAGTLQLAPGVYSLTLRATNAAGGQGTSPATNFVVQTAKQGNSAQALSQEVPTTMRAGQPYTVTLRLLNNGTTTWTHGTAYRLGTQNPQDTKAFGVFRAYLNNDVPTGGTAVFTFQVTAPSNPGTYNFQWRMLREHVEWFGDLTQNVPIVVFADSGPAVTLTASPTNARVSGTQLQNISFTGSGGRAGATVTKLELFQDSGRGFGMTPIHTTTGNAATLKYAYTHSLPAGVYLFKLRVTDSVGVQTDSAQIPINVTNSTLLGTVSGVRSNTAGKPELYGWVCQPGSEAGLAYKVLLDAPTFEAGASLLTEGVANLSTERDNAAVRAQCATPGAGHHFVVDLSSYLASHAGRSLYVQAETSGAVMKVTLPCADNSCTMPSTLRVGLTTPLDGDRVQGPGTVFMRMQLSNQSGTYDEVGFVVDGKWVAAAADGAAGAYSASLSGLAAREVPYTVYAKVRQGKMTLQSVSHQFTVGQGVAATVAISSPSNGAAVGLAAQNLLATTTGQVASVRFFVDSTQLAGSATASGSTWSQSWIPAVARSYTLYARAFDANGTQLAQSATVSVTASANGGSGAQAPMPAPPYLDGPNAGTLPGSMSVDSVGDANYQIPLVLPPGTNGMQPQLALAYKGMGTNGLLGLGWSMSGLSRIHRCGKTIAQDGVNERINFSDSDRLCLDGQRMVLVDRAQTDANYWTVGAEYRLELDNFTRIFAQAPVQNGRLSFEVRTRDGRISNYGTTTDSAVDAVIGAVNSGLGGTQPQQKNGAQSWAIAKTVDRVGNFIQYFYDQDATFGEHRPTRVSYGGAGKAAHAHVQFTYENRSDTWKRYVDESRNDLRTRLSGIKTSTGNIGGGEASLATVREYALTYESSPTSGRSLLVSIGACATHPDTRARECLPATTFDWGKPSQTPRFKSWGIWPNAPVLTTNNPRGGYDGNLPTARVRADYFAFSDFNADGFADVLEKRVASPTPADIGTAEGRARESSNPISPGTMRAQYRYWHNTGTGFVEHTYQLDTMEQFAVLDVGDFNGDGKLDLFVHTASAGSKVCLSPVGDKGPLTKVISFNCVATYPNGWNNSSGGRAYVFDPLGDGRAGVYSTITAAKTARYCDLQVGCMTDANPPAVLGKGDALVSHFDGDHDFGAYQYTSFTDMVDFAGIGIPSDVRWTEPYFQQYSSDPEHAPVNDWFNTNGQILMTSLGRPGANRAGMAPFNYPLNPMPTNAQTLRWPYTFDKPYQASGMQGDFSGSGYSSLAFGYIAIGWENATAPTNKQAEFTICLSTGRALDCAVRQKYSGSNYRAIQAVGEFVGDGQPAILASPVVPGNPGSRPVASGDLEICRLRGDDTTNGQGVNDSNIVCAPWAGPKLPMADPTAGYNEAYFMDLLGTGRPQLVIYHSGKWSGSTWVEDGRWEVFEPMDVAAPGQALDRIHTVTNGLGATQTVEYVDSLPSGVATTTGSISRTYPVQPHAAARKIVHRLVSSNGVAGPRSVSYRFADSANDVSGRGNLGFATVTATDEQTGFVTTTQYAQDWPYVGFVRTATTTAGSCVISKITSTPASMSFTHASGAKIYFTYAANSEVIKRDLNCAPLSTVTTTSAYEDQWGNLTTQSVTTTGAGETFDTTTITSYRNDAARWLLGLPLHVTTTKVSPGRSGLTRTVDFTYNAETGLPESETVEAGNKTYEVVTNYYRKNNPFGLVDEKTQTWQDPASLTTKTRLVNRITFDENGRYPATVVNALGHAANESYYPATGVRKSVTDPNRLTTSWRADGFGRVESETRPDGNETRTYVKRCTRDCPSGTAVVQIVDRFNGITRVSVPELAFSDEAGHVLRTQTWNFSGRQIVVDRRYDVRGRLWETDRPRFTDESSYLESRQEYDDLDRVKRVTTFTEGRAAVYTTTDYNGFELTQVNPLGQRRIEKRNAVGLLKQVIDPNQKVTQFEYEQFGNLAKTTDPNLNVVQVGYDLLGRKTQLKDPNLGTITYTIDPLGRVVAQRSPKQLAANEASGRDDRTRFQYDDLDRMTARLETDLESRWIFDTAVRGIGQLAEAYTVRGSAKDYRRLHSYDDVGRPATTTQMLYNGADGNFSVTEEYDTFGRLSRQTYRRDSDLAKVFDRRYSTTGYLYRIERAGMALWELVEQDASLQARGVKLGNGLTQTRDMSPATGRMTGGTLKTATDGLRLVEDYTFDAIGNVKQRSQFWDAGGFQEQFDYDTLNRLERSTVSGQAAQIFTYDNVGNIKSKTGVGSGNYVYPAQGAGSVRPNAVSSIPGIGSFGYDVNGNMISGPGRTVTWTSYDMPQRIDGPVSSSTFVYGPEHQRVRQERSDGTVFIYAGAQEVERQGTTVRVKTYWPMGLGMESDRGSVTELNWVHVDRLGSPIGYTDQAGNLTDRLGYAAWGKRRTPNGTLENGTDTPDSIDGKIDNRGFTGHEMLEKLELVHMNGRVFDPLLGRFMSADPMIEDPTNGQSYNRYSYVLNNPTNLVDPTGFSSANAADPQKLVDGEKVVRTGSKIPGVDTGASVVQIAEPANEKEPNAKDGSGNGASSVNSGSGQSSTGGISSPSSGGVEGGQNIPSVTVSAPRPDSCELICINQTTLLAYPRTFVTGNFIEDNVRNYYSKNAASVWNAGRSFYKTWVLTSLSVLGATSGGSVVAALSKENVLLEALANAKPTSGHPNQLMVTLEDGTRVIFRKDFGERAHNLGGPFQGKGRIDHYNIEVQVKGRDIENLHIVPNGSNGFIYWGRDKVIKQ